MFMLLYADDIAILATSAEELQKCLDVLENYCDTWKLKVNVNKTKVMVFRKGGKTPNNLAFTYDGKNLEIVKRFNYLGVVFTSGGSLTEAQKTLAGQALKAVFKLNKYLYKFTFISIKHRLELFDKLVSPILGYASQVWGFSSATEIERVHLQFCKNMLSIKITTQNDFVYGELGRITCIANRYYHLIRYWLTIICMDERKYVKVVYNILVDDMNRTGNITNWASMLKQLLCSLGFNDVWLAQGVGDIKAFLIVAKQRVRDQFVQNWHSRLENSSRALFYVQVSNFKLQPYLEVLNSSKLITAMARIRVSSHRLMIETGRWNKPVAIPLNERRCQTCNVLEDEFHFILECRKFENIRRKYIESNFWCRPNMVKFVNLMSSERPETVKCLSLYVYYALKKRNELQ